MILIRKGEWSVAFVQFVCNAPDMQTTSQKAFKLGLLTCLWLAALVLPTLTAGAQTTTFTDRAAWEAFAGTPSTVFDFTTRDDGCPITFPVNDVAFSPITLRGADFLGARSYWNLSLYVFPAQGLQVNLPAGTYAFGTDLSPFHLTAGTYTVRLSTGDIYSFSAALVPWVSDFFGVHSSVDIAWVQFSYDTEAMVLDNFAYLPGQKSLAIDIRPKSLKNRVDLQSTGKLPVAVLGSPTFDPHLIDVASLRLGATGQEAAPVNRVFKDVNGDGEVDLQVRFTIADIGLSCTTKQLMLKGSLQSGQVIVGNDFVYPANCTP